MRMTPSSTLSRDAASTALSDTNMADSTAKQEKRTGRPKILTDSGRKRKKKELDAKRGKSRISIGEELERWTALKERLGLNSHAEVAKVLLDR